MPDSIIMSDSDAVEATATVMEMAMVMEGIEVEAEVVAEVGVAALITKIGIGIYTT